MLKLKGTFQSNRVIFACSSSIPKIGFLGGWIWWITANLKYSRDCGWPRRPWPNAGRRKQKKRPKNHLFFFKKLNVPKENIIFLHISSSYAKILGEHCTLYTVHCTHHCKLFGLDPTVLYTNIVFFQTGNRFTHVPHVNCLEWRFG